MNKERLQEIKDSIDLQRKLLIEHNMQTLCVDEEMELYNEIIRLKKQKADVVEYIKEYDKKGIKSWNEPRDDLLRMLGEIDETSIYK